MYLMKVFFFFTLSLLIQVSITGQEWVSYKSEQQINDLVETDDEMLMATDAGLVVVNKLTLEKTIFNKSNSNLANDHIQRIAMAPNGDVWIGTYDIIMMRFDGSDFEDAETPLSADYDPDNTNLYDFEIAPNGDFWFGSNDGVFHKSGQNWSTYDQEEIGADFFEAWDIAINDEGEVFLGSSFIHKFANGEWSNISEDTQMLSYLDAELFFSSTGDLFYSGDLERIGRYDGQEWQLFDYPGVNGFEAMGFREDQNGNVYLNTLQNSIFQFENNNWVPIENEQTLAFENRTPFYYIDSEGNEWLNDRVYFSVKDDEELRFGTISEYTLESNSIRNIHKSDEGNLYFLNGSEDVIPVLTPTGEWLTLPLPDFQLAADQINDILYLADDNIWLGSFYGLYHFDGTEWTWEMLEPCRSFVRDSQGKIYVQTNSRVHIIEDGEISEYTSDNSGISSLIISGIAVDANDNLWIASFDWDGASAIQKLSTDGTWTTYSGDDHPEFGRPGFDIHFDNEGNMWVVDDIKGVIKFDGTTFSNPILDNAAQLENTDIFSMTSDASGKMYFAHQTGVVTFFNGEWEDLIIEEVANVSSSHKATIEMDDQGTLWWGSQSFGLYSYATGISTSVASEIELNKDFSVYPNPATDYFVLDFNLNESAKVKVFVYNTLGQLQSSYDLGQLAGGQNQETINVEGLPKGLYTVQLQINNKLIAKKILVQ